MVSISHSKDTPWSVYVGPFYARPTGDKDITGSISAGSATFVRGVSRRAVVSFWRKKICTILVYCLED